jgi:hypothetical protein
MEEDEHEGPFQAPGSDVSLYGAVGGDIPMTDQGFRPMDIPAIRSSGQIDPAMRGTLAQYPMEDAFLPQYPTI